MTSSILPEGIRGFGASIIDGDLNIFIKSDIKAESLNTSEEFDAQVQKSLIACVTHINKMGLALKGS